MVDIYKTTLNGAKIGFFSALNWADASRAAASYHKQVTGEAVPWVNFTTAWLNPKHFEAEGVPPELYAEEEVAG